MKIRGLLAVLALWSYVGCIAALTYVDRADLAMALVIGPLVIYLCGAISLFVYLLGTDGLPSMRDTSR